jgi:hypothetical protein
LHFPDAFANLPFAWPWNVSLTIVGQNYFIGLEEKVTQQLFIIHVKKIGCQTSLFSPIVISFVLNVIILIYLHDN